MELEETEDNIMVDLCRKRCTLTINVESFLFCYSHLCLYMENMIKDNNTRLIAKTRQKICKLPIFVIVESWIPIECKLRTNFVYRASLDREYEEISIR